MSEGRFGVQPHLDRLYEGQARRFALTATSENELLVWKREFRAELLGLLGLAGREVPEASYEMVHSEPREGYTEEKYAVDSGEGVATPAYVLVPEGPGPFKPVMVFHGHNPSVQPVIGNFGSDEERRDRLSVDGNYAQALAQAGYLVCAVEQRGFGERHSALRKADGGRNSCRHMAFFYQLLGRTLIGERCWDGMRAIDMVLERTDVDKGALGCTGNSGGGTTTLWLSAIEERITCSIPSCYFCSFRASILGVPHCECNYVPGILKLAEMGEIGALIAPRPLRVIAGEKDNIFPVQAVREQFETVKRGYSLAGAADTCDLAVHDGPHAYKHAFAKEWFDRWL